MKTVVANGIFSFMSWIYYKFTTPKGRVFQRRIDLNPASRLSVLAVESPDMAMKVIKDELCPGSAINIFSVGHDPLPNPPKVGPIWLGNMKVG